jgi:hypothetical protein
LARSEGFAAFWLVFVLMTTMVQAEDRGIAEIGGRHVLYMEIGCNREWAAANPQWLKGRSVETACVEAEREKFRQLTSRILIEQICEIEGCELSEEELDAYRSPVLKDDDMLRRLAIEGRKVPEAVRRVYLGEPIEAVYEEVIKPMNRTLDAFRREVAMYRSLDVVERYLAKDSVAVARQHYENEARQRAMRATIRDRIATIANGRHQAAKDAARDYFHAMVGRIGVRVLDEQFQLPSPEEVFR